MDEGQRGAEDDPGLRLLAPAARPVVEGTDTRAVLAEAKIAPRLDVSMALAFLVHGEYDAYRSFAAGVALAPPRCPIHRYPDGVLGIRRGRAPTRLDLDREASAAAFRAVVLDATEDAVRPHTRVGLWLSGGVDSSVVTAAAVLAWKGLGRDPKDLQAYHHLPADGDGEVAWARAAAQKLGIELREIPAATGDPYAASEAFFAHLDVPSDGGGPATTLEIARQMREDGVDVFLTGDGGDEAFGALEPVTGRDRLRRALPGPLPGWLRRRLPRRGLPAWLSSAAPDRHAIHTSPSPRRGLRADGAWRDRMIRCARQVAIVQFLRAVGQVAEAKAACPLLDRRVADLCVVLPPRFFKNGVPKSLAQRAFAAELPSGERPLKAEQPAAEGAIQADLARYGPAWADRWFDGGVLENLGIVPLGAGSEILTSAAAGPPQAIYRAMAALGLEIYARARLDVEA